MQPIDPAKLELLEAKFGSRVATANALGVTSRQYLNYCKSLLAPAGTITLIELLVRKPTSNRSKKHVVASTNDSPPAHPTAVNE